MTVRVRFAPSPTGHLHIGSVRTALFNFLYARHHGGDFVLRIEDTDTNRNIEGAELAFLDGFRWLGMKWDEGTDIGGPYAPYRCMERLDIYREHVVKLLDKGIAYPCFCTDEELAQQREAAEREGRVPRYSGVCYRLSEAERQEKIAQGIPHSIRFHVPENRELVVDDLVRGQVTFNSSDIGDYVIVKSNGIPTYNFQVVVDDAAMKITHVIRAEEHLSNTPRQILVFQAFGYDIPKFAHLPIVLDQHRKKLSKRDPSVLPIQKYEELGYVPHAIINFLALLGWSPEGEQELFDLESLASQFDLDRISKAGAVFDVDKLNWMANQYFKALDLDVATVMVQKQLDRAEKRLPEGVSDDWLPQIVALFQEQMVCASDFLRLSEGFFEQRVTYDEEAQQLLAEPGSRQVVEAYLALASVDEAWTADASRARFKQIQKEQGVKGRALFMPVRAAITGQVHGPDLQKTIALLPKDWVLDRLASALESRS
ncbi:glutamate--tRNA ligase [Alicyclobacillus fastidiosus]|uniref:Glutamate--tRNA ligase n=1 Tax=Alicyclobacillus fastidiosus TaxID=392011 RepID=A0ABV5AIT2_9BACL|nr:glutamate--tRNA ligase [Alicyclobacillus fastidiosus]WEH09971.1 glutamate--tRNA ligase [Alicyclobacillus fastidiosus]